MAEKGYTPVTVFPLFKNKSLSAGDVGTSDPIDLQYSAQQGYFSLYFQGSAGTSTTCGTTVFTYRGCSTRDGVYVAPAASVAIGTAGQSGTTCLNTFEPEPMPWMRILATQTGAGTAGANTKINADLIVQ
jgi:hypothetical protein